MLKIDIITGYLGAGKTTFIHKYANYIRSRGEKILIIENEFGLTSIDSPLLSAEKFEIMDISGGCACCSGKNKLISCIISAIKLNFDRVIIEPSGIYNLDAFFDVFDIKEIEENAVLNGIITIVKPDFMKHSKDGFESIFYSHFLSTGAIVFSNTQSYASEEIEKSMRELNSFMKCKYPNFSIENITVFKKEWDNFSDDDFIYFSKVGRTYASHIPIYEVHTDKISVEMVVAKAKSLQDIDDIMQFIFGLPNSKIFRVKGFFALENGSTYSVNFTDNCKEVKPAGKHTPIINILGQNIATQEIYEYLQKFTYTTS